MIILKILRSAPESLLSSNANDEQDARRAIEYRDFQSRAFDRFDEKIDEKPVW